MEHFLCEILKVQKKNVPRKFNAAKGVKFFLYIEEICRRIGDWSNGMIGVSKTFGGSSILSSPVKETAWKPHRWWFPGCFLC